MKKNEFPTVSESVLEQVNGGSLSGYTVPVAGVKPPVSIGPTLPYIHPAVK